MRIKINQKKPEIKPTKFDENNNQHTTHTYIHRIECSVGKH